MFHVGESKPSMSIEELVANLWTLGRMLIAAIIELILCICAPAIQRERLSWIVDGERQRTKIASMKDENVIVIVDMGKNRYTFSCCIQI